MPLFLNFPKISLKRIFLIKVLRDLAYNKGITPLRI